MEEAEAQALLDVPRETFERLRRLVQLVAGENAHQNLVSNSSLEHIWSRHVVDSAQLLPLAPAKASSWLDLGAGAGFPGLVVGLLHRSTVTLVESRRLRADFLSRAAQALDLANVEVVCARVERMEARPFDVISARAFAPLERIFALGERFSMPSTRWILPKGRSAKTELDAARASWQGVFRLEPSVTDAEAGIVVAEQVRRSKQGKISR